MLMKKTFHHSLLKNIDFSKHDLIINYFTPLLTTVGGDEDENIKKVLLNAQRNILIERKLLHEIKIKNPDYEILLKICAVAKEINATVQGDDGEFYENGQIKADT